VLFDCLEQGLGLAQHSLILVCFGFGQVFLDHTLPGFRLGVFFQQGSMC
jgi:hypothetical protein